MRKLIKMLQTWGSVGVYLKKKNYMDFKINILLLIIIIIIIIIIILI